MLTLISKLNGVDLVRIRDDVLTARVLGGTPQDYPWDRWEAKAKAVGLSAELVSLGRAVFREAYQHQWNDDLQIECGWLDGGRRMIYQALAFPAECTARWSHLMEADGSPDFNKFMPVTLDPYDLADALEANGFKTGFLR